MKISKAKIKWIVLLVPFLKPDIVLGTFVSEIWNYTQFISLLIGLTIIVKGKKYLKPNASVFFIIVYYGFQVIADVQNSVPFWPDLSYLIKMTVVLISLSILLLQYRTSFLLFLYKLFCLIIYVNGFSVLISFGNGLSQDSYGSPIFFWATKNHIISIVIVALVIGYILVEKKSITRRSYKTFYALTSAEIILLNSSTAIISLIVFTIFIFINRYFSKHNKPINQIRMIIFGFVLQISIVVFRIQNQFEWLLSTFFHKNATLTDRTIIWDQAFIEIASNWLWGKGNANAAGVGGWITKSYWDNASMQMEDIYLVAHNQFLEIMLNGGIFTVLFFIASFISMCFCKINNSKIKNCITGGIFAYLVVMITEVVYPYLPVWIFIIIGSSEALLNETISQRNK